MQISLGWIALIVLSILGVGFLAGWWAARARWMGRVEPGGAGQISRLTPLLEALPQAAVIADADANVIACNLRAGSLLTNLGGSAALLPSAIGLAAGRVAHSRIAEVLEIGAPDDPMLRLRASISAVQPDFDPPVVLVLFGEAKAEGGRTQVYRRLMNVIAHELRTPLTAILGHVEILTSCTLEEEALWKRSLGFISGEVDRLARLVEDLLSLSRLDHIPVHVRDVNMRLIAEEALSSLFEKAERSGVTLVLQAPSELPRVQADPDRIRQVFINLLDNSIKYAPGSVVTAELRPDGSRFQVEIRDDGPGIAPQDLPHLFDPLYRSENVPAGAEGSGLGLTIVRLILDQHHAAIRVRSEPGRGAAFSFSLPLVAPGSQTTEPRRAV